MAREGTRATEERKPAAAASPTPASAAPAPPERLALQDALGNAGTTRYLRGLRLKAQGGGAGLVPSDARAAAVVAEIASAGFGGRSRALPHLAQIQDSFGGHDVRAVDAHVGGDAAVASEQLGARAYARGEQVAFREGPDLHTAAHEAAHVVQQRQGGVQLRGAVGEPGDRFERHADAVADLVVAGASAEPLLGAPVPAGEGAASAGVQLHDYGDADFIPFSDIEMLPSRAQYEAKGELQPRRPADWVDPNAALISLGGAGPVVAKGEPPKGAELGDLGHPHPIPETLGQDAETMTPPEMVMRLAAMEVLATHIARLVAQQPEQVEAIEVVSLLISSTSRHVSTPNSFGDTFYSFDAPADTRIPTEPEPLSREIVRSEAVLDRLADGIAEVADELQREAQVGGSLVVSSQGRKGLYYDLGGALGGLRDVQERYVAAADAVLTPRFVHAFNDADKVHGETNEYVRRLKISYFESEGSQFEGGQRFTNAINSWAIDLDVDLAWLQEQAPRIRAARDSHTLDISLQQEFVARAAMVGTSIEALAEYDRAAAVYEAFYKGTALTGFEDLKRIRWRLEQMRDAAADRDLDYLKVLLRDFQKDPKVSEFYASVPKIIHRSQLIVGLAVAFVASLAAAGVGIAFTAATGVTAAEVSFFSWTFAARTALQSVAFTLVSHSLQSVLSPGAELKPLWRELIEGFVLFYLMGGAGFAMRGALKTLGPITGALVSHGVNFGIIQTWGYLHASIEAGELLSADAFIDMAEDNLIMVVGLAVLMKPFEPIIHGLEKDAATAHFERTYRDKFAKIEAARETLAKEIEAGIRSNPNADAKPEVLDKLRAQGKEIDDLLKATVKEALNDPRCDTAKLRIEVAEMYGRAQRAALPEVLRSTGLDPGMEIMPVGPEGAWSFPKGQGEALKEFLVRSGYEVSLDTSTAGGRVIEATVPGKGPVQFIERPTAERVVVPLTEGELASARGKMAEGRAEEIAGGTRGRGAYIVAEQAKQTPESVTLAAKRLASGLAREGLRLGRIAQEGQTTKGVLRVDVPARQGKPARVAIEVSIEVEPVLAGASVHGEEGGYARVTVSRNAEGGWKLDVKLDGRLASEADVQHNLRHELREGAGIIAELTSDPSYNVEAAHEAGVFGPGDSTTVTPHARAAAMELRDVFRELEPALQKAGPARQKIAMGGGGEKMQRLRDAGDIAMRRLDAALESNGFADPATRAAKVKALLEVLGETADSPVGRYVEQFGERYDAGVRRTAALDRLSAPEREALRSAVGSALELHFFQRVPETAIDALNQMTKLGAGREARELVRRHAAGNYTDEQFMTAVTEGAVKAQRVSEELEPLRAKVATMEAERDALLAQRGRAMRWVEGALKRVMDAHGEARAKALDELAGARAALKDLDDQVEAKRVERRPFEKEVNRLERDLRGGRRDYSGIGGTGSIGEEYLKGLGGRSQVLKSTPFGDRYIDQLVGKDAHEAKVGEMDIEDSDTTSRTEDSHIKTQIAKDQWLLLNKVESGIKSVTWHFFRSPITGKGGPSLALQKALDAAGITYVTEPLVVY